MEQKKYRALLTQKQYIKLFIADLISRFGDSLDTVAYSWIMYEVTGSASLMALVVGLNYLPTVFLMPFAGAVADRRNKKLIMVLADVIRFLIVSSIVILYSTGLLNAVIIAVFTLLTSTLEAFRIPAGGAILPRLLSPDCFTLGKAASYSSSRMAELLGYIFAGVIIAWIGSGGALWIDAATFLISAVIISLIRCGGEKTTGKSARGSVIRDFTDGLRFVKTNKAVQTIAFIGLLINFGIMPLSVFQTPYVSDCLEMGPTVLSYIKILMTTGMMAGAAILPKIRDPRKQNITAAAGTGMGMTLILMGITPEIGTEWMKMAALTISMFFVGVGGGMLNVVVGSTMMKAVPKGMMGRVSAFIGSIMQASMPVASFICSALAISFTIPWIFGAFGVLTIVAYVTLFVTKRMSDIDQKSDDETGSQME